MDIFLVHLVASILSALCVKYLANLKINIFLRILIYKFKYKCATGKNYKVEILDNNYTLKDLESKNISWDNHTLYLSGKEIAKFSYEPCMKYNYFVSKMLSVSVPNTTLCCDKGLNQRDRFELTLKALKNNKFLKKDKR